MKRVLLADSLPEQCATILEEAGFEVESRPGLSPDELREAVRGVSGIACRSGVRITAEVIAAADSLEAICRAGVGVDNIDVPAASHRGVVVMNTPGANTISTAEHAFALMMALARNIGPAYISMREGRWEKKKFTGTQLSGSKLAIIGLGRIGQEIAKRAVAFGMLVRAYDPYVGRDTASKIGVELIDDLDELLSDCHYLTIHVPENDQTKGLLNAERLSRLRAGACIINCARGGVVDLDAAVDAIERGTLGGAAFDVYVKEPPASFDFARHDRVLATPHLGASTEEAQLAVGVQAAEQLVDALSRRHYRNALNVSPVPPEEMKLLRPYCELAAKLGNLVAQLSTGRPEELRVSCKGDIAQENIEPIVNHGAMGVMQSSLGGQVNIVSAPYLARERGIHITSSSTMGAEAGFTDLVEVELKTDAGALSAAGTLFGKTNPRIVRIADFYVEILPQGEVLIAFGKDVPGLIGKIGALMGEAGVNIARMGFGRVEAGGRALLALNLDSPCDDATVQMVRDVSFVDEAVRVHL
jgi:D-3-phosphoglycerate dehydrogenase